MAADVGCLRLCLGTTLLLYLSVSSGRPVSSVGGVVFVRRYIPVCYFFSCAFKNERSFENKKIKQQQQCSSRERPFVFSVIYSVYTHTHIHMRAYVCNVCRDNPVGETRPKHTAGRLLEWFRAFPENVTERTITGIKVKKKKEMLMHVLVSVSTCCICSPFLILVVFHFSVNIFFYSFPELSSTKG